MLFLVLLKGVRDERVEYSRNLVLSAAFLAVVYVLLPRIVFGSAYADMRLAPYVLAIALIALRPRRGLSFRGASTLAIVGLLFFVVRIGAGAGGSRVDAMRDADVHGICSLKRGPSQIYVEALP